MSDNQEAAATSTPSMSRFPSLDLVFDLTRERLSAQLASVDSLDTKANFVLGSATLLTAAAATVQGLSHYDSAVRFVAIIFAMLLYLAVIFTSFRAYMVRGYHQAPDPTALEGYMWEQLETTKGTILKEMVGCYNDNKKEIARKVWWLRWALRAFGAEAVLLSILALLEVLH